MCGHPGGICGHPRGSVPVPGLAWLLALAHFGKRPWEWHLCRPHVPAEAELIPGCGMGAEPSLSTGDPINPTARAGDGGSWIWECCSGGRQPEPGFSASLRSSCSRSSKIPPRCSELGLPEHLRWHGGHPGSSRGMGVSRQEQRAGGTRCLHPQPPAPQSNKTTEGPRGDAGIRSRPGAGPGAGRGRCRGSLLTMPTALKRGIRVFVSNVCVLCVNMRDKFEITAFSLFIFLSNSRCTLVSLLSKLLYCKSDAGGFFGYFGFCFCFWFFL